jgi:peptidoglycan hydrolase-like protein with peptidoglycan-binding domain
MRTINLVPLLRQGERGPAVEDVQHLLNVSDRDGAGHVWSKTDFLEEDGAFGPLTRAKVCEFQKVSGLQVDGVVGPQTNAALFAPQADRIDQAQGIATNWTLIAKGAVHMLRVWVQALLFDEPTPGGDLTAFVEALRVHFHIDLPAPPQGPNAGRGSANPLDLLQADDRLSFIQQVFEDVDFVLSQASIRGGRVFHSLGPRQSELLKLTGKSAGIRNVPSSQGKVMLVCFPPSFAVTTNPDFFRTTHQQASTVLHESCHYVRPRSEGSREVEDFAYGLPAFAGQPSRVHPAHNYQQLTAEEAVHNAESYNLFAEHVTFGRDTRFGRLSSDLATFECGSLAGCD